MSSFSIPEPDAIEVPRWELRACTSSEFGRSHFYVDRWTGETSWRPRPHKDVPGSPRPPAVTITPSPPASPTIAPKSKSTSPKM